MFPKVLFSGAFFAFSAVLAFSQTLSFPGALGYGAYATGGRNGTVYHVTNTNDSGAGSFRDAVSQPNRTIVFDVGGYINLQSAVAASSSLTIAGQTAPGGIGLQGQELSFYGQSNIVCRYLRVRQGGSNTTQSGINIGASSSTSPASNLIFDHTSVAFGQWDSIDAVNTANFTIQFCIIADPINQQFGAHVEGTDATYVNNLWVNAHNRQPLAKANTIYVNNVIYDFQAGYTCGNTGGNFFHDIIGNYFIAGPSTTSAGDDFYQVDANQSVYASGNLVSSTSGTLNGSATAPGGVIVLNSPWSPVTETIPTVPAPDAYKVDLSGAGAFPIDQLDQQVLSEVMSLGTSGRIIGATTDTGLGNSGYGTITAGTAASNFSGDGIADYWKLANNLSTNISYPLTNTATGYTLLENYLNFLAGPHAVTQTNTPVLVNLSQFIAGFSASATFSLTNNTNGTVSLVNGTNANFVPNANFSGLATFTFTVTDSGYTLSAPVAVCVTPAAPPASAAGFNGALTTVATNAAATVVIPPNNLVWHGDGTANVWNTSVSNWLNGASASLFKNTDIVTFDDTGSASPAVNLTTSVSPGAIFFNDSENNYTLSGVGSLGGSAPLSKTGTGTLTVNTTNSGFSGPITVNGGALVVGPSASIGTGNITLGNGTTLTTSLGGALVTVSGAITVASGASASIGSGGQLGNEYSGNLVSGNTNSILNLINGISFDGSSSSQFSSFNGTINITSGSTLRFALASSGNTFGSLNPTFAINGTLQPRNAGNTIQIGALNGSGQLTGPQTAGTGSGNTLYIIGGNNLNGIFTGTIVSNANSAGSVVCFDKIGAGNQVLGGNNTITGTNAVLGGTLTLNGTNMPSLLTVFTNATLCGTGVINGNVAVNNGGIVAPGGSSSGSFGTFTINGNLTNNSPVFNFDLSSSPAGSNDLINLTGTLAMTGPQMFNFTLASNALGAGTYSLIQGATNSTASNVTLTNNLPANTRQTITLSRPAAGSNPSFIQLIVSGSANSLLWRGTNGASWDTSTTNWFNGATADQYYNLDAVTFDDTATISTPALATALQPAAILVTNNSLAYTFGGTGSLMGSGPLTKNGSGTLTVATVNNSYSGSITVNGGTLAVGSGDNLGSGLLTLGNNTTLALPNSGSSVGLANPIFIPAGQTNTITSGLLSSTLSGNLSSGNSASTLNLNGGVSFGGTTSAQFDGFTGTINIQPGVTLRYSPNSSGNTFGSFHPVMVINGILQPRNDGNTVELGAFTGSGMLAGPQSNAGSGGTLYVIGGNNTSANFAGVISSNTAVPGSIISVNKIGAGTLTLSGNNTYTGDTTVSGGELIVNNTSGSATGSGNVDISSGATLAGSGSIAGSATVEAGATLSPGTGTGTLTFNSSLSLDSASLLQFGLGANSDQVVVNGTLFLGGVLNVQNTGGFGVGTYPLFTCNPASGLTVGTVTLGTLPAGYNYSLNTNTPGVVNLIVAPTTPPNFKGINLNSGSLTLAGSNGVPLGNYLVLQSSNLFNWSIIATNQFDANGGFNFTTNLPTGSPQNFFRLQLQ